MNDERVRIAIVGGGRTGAPLLEALGALPYVDVVGVADHDPDSPGAQLAIARGIFYTENPSVLVIVTIDEPSRAIYGGTVAAPTFSRIARFCVEHLKIPPGTPVTATSQGSGG